MAQLIATWNGGSAGPWWSNYVFHVRVHLYLDSVDATGWNIHWDIDTYFESWPGYSTDFQSGIDVAGFTDHIPYYEKPYNTPYWTHRVATQHHNFGATFACNGAYSQYTGDSGTTYRSDLARAEYTVPRPTYSVGFDANGGVGAPGAQTKTYGYALTLSSTQPTRPGFHFEGWATSPSGSVAYPPGGTYTADAAVTLYAVWSRLYDVSYDANGGGTAPAAQAKVRGVALALAGAIADRAGWSFVAWNTEADGSGAAYAAGGSYAVDADVKLYAQWEPHVDSVTIGEAARAIRVADGSSAAEADEGTWAYVTVPVTVRGAAACTAELSVSASGAGTAVSYDARTASKASQGEADLTATLVARASGLELDEKYTIEVTVSVANDSVSQAAVTASRTLVVPMAFLTMDVRAGGHGIGFGAPARYEDTVYSAMDVLLDGTITLGQTELDEGTLKALIALLQ